MHGIGRELRPRPMAHGHIASDPLTGRLPTLLLAPPRAPPCGSYRVTRSVYSSYTATVNAAFEWLFHNTSAGQRTSALRSIDNKTWKASLALPVPGHARSEPCCPLPAVPGTCSKQRSQRSPAVNRGQSPWPLTRASAA